jgi:hypothetical protein
MHRALRGSRKIWTAVASGDEQMQQLRQPTLCDGSAHEYDFFGRHRRRSLRLPRSRLRERRTQTSYELFAANGTIAHTYGCITLRLDLRLRREFSWHFIAADVTGPIIGSDFLPFYKLLVDIRHRRLIDNSTNLNVNGVSVGTYGGHIKHLARSFRYHALLLDFADIIRPAGVPREPRHSKSITSA